MADPIKSFMGNIGELTVAKKTSLLFIVMVLGMLFIGSFAHLSLNRIKNDFDILYNKYTLAVIKLEDLKDIYSVNILDTLKDMEEEKITKKDAKSVIFLALQMIKKNWFEYKKSLNIDESDWLVKTLRDWGMIPKNLKSSTPTLKEDLIVKVDERIEVIDGILHEVFTKFEHTYDAEAYALMEGVLYPSVHSINIHLTQLISFSLETAKLGKHRTDKIYHNTFEWIVAGVVGTIVIAALFAVVILQNIRQLYSQLERVVQLKTKELVELNLGLEKRIEHEIEESRKKDEIMYRQSRLAAMGEMIGNIAHQWRQPLNALGLIMQSFQTKQMLGKLNEEFVDVQVGEGMMLVNSMSKTIDDFRDYFKPKNSKKVFDIATTINSAISMLKNYYAKDKIEISLKNGKKYEVLGFDNEFFQVIMNLLSNSKDALLKVNGKRFIDIILSEEDEFTCKVDVIDNGGGIKDEITTRIFEPYFTTKHKASGTGIGLYMSKQIIEKQMNGKIKTLNVSYKRDGVIYEKCAKMTLYIPIKNHNKG